jgi:site-specific DNA-methyltransferase (adenine-specific)
MLPLNQLILGDALKEMRKLPSGSIDLILTSPPYNLGNRTRNGRNYAEKNRSGGKSTFWEASTLSEGYAAHDDAMPRAEYVAWQKEIISECWRLLADDGALFYVHKPRVQDGILQHPIEYVPPGVPLRQIIVWHRNSKFTFTHRHFANDHELILLFAKPNWTITHEASGYGDVWHLLPDRDKTNKHPAPFPLTLAERVLSVAPSSKIILDPFVGSGTTAVAAMRNGRQYIGIDNSAEYLQDAQARLEKKRKQPLLFAI